MNIAVIDIDVWWRRRLIDIISPEDEISFFSSHEEFGKAKISNYDIIFIEYKLPGGLSGEEIAKAIGEKTNATIALMGERHDWISKKIVTNGHIEAVLDKSIPDQFIKFLESVHHKNIIHGYFDDAMKQLNRMKEAILQ